MPYAPLLDEAAIRDGLAGVPEWQRDGDTIRREIRFPTFAEAIGFVDRVAVVAETADHHPDIDIRWRRVMLVLTTKASRGLTWRDFDLARRIDALLTQPAA
jgi:4a-hydroxytetrahydrobiopterin dehydratase